MTDVGPARARNTVVYPDLAGKVAVVTGGSRGIGAETARALAENGVSVAVVGRDKAALSSTTDTITADGSRVLGLAADCTVEQDLAVLGQAVESEFEPVDILATFAGGNGCPSRRRPRPGRIGAKCSTPTSPPPFLP